MPGDDYEIMARFNRRLAAIDNEIPSPPALESLRAASRDSRAQPRVALRAGPALLTAAALLVVAVIAIRLLPDRGPTPTAPAVGQTAVPSPPLDPSPSRAPTPAPSADSTSIASPSSAPTPSSVPSPTPTTEPSHGCGPIPSAPPADPVPSTGCASLPPTETPSPTPSGPAAADLWRPVAAWPQAPAHVAAVVAGGPGFVAVGYEVAGDYLCERPEVDGIVWTSPDGQSWTESRPDALAGLALARLVNAGGTLYAFGSVGHSDCVAESARAIARSRDGSSWERLEPDLPDGLFVSALGASGGDLVAFTEEDSAFWTSADGTHWERGGSVPLSYSWFRDIESIGGTLVAFDGFTSNPILVSQDGGASWTHADLTLPFSFTVSDTFVGNGRIVAVGSACCALPNESVGMALSSADGVHWESSASFSDVPLVVGAALSDRYLAVGEETWFSRDGIDWLVGPATPDMRLDDVLTAVSTDAGILLSSATCCHTVGHENVSAAWFASSSAIAAGQWLDAPREAQMPEIGVRYPAEVFTHCGFPEVSFGLRTWTADPPFEDNFNPPPGFREKDRGWFTQLSEDQLLYESRGGKTVNLVPSTSAGAGPCA
jgi:hypothetical protein